MYVGAHSDNAPATNATHVKPNDENTKLRLKNKHKAYFRISQLVQPMANVGEVMKLLSGNVGTKSLKSSSINLSFKH